MLLVRTEQKARPCLDDAPQPGIAQLLTDAHGLRLPVVSEGIEVMPIKREGHPIIARCRNQVDSVVEAMISTAIRIISVP